MGKKTSWSSAAATWPWTPPAAPCACRRKEVTIVYRRGRAKCPPLPEEIAQAEEEGVKFELLTNPIKVIASSGGKSRAGMPAHEAGRSRRQTPAPPPVRRGHPTSPSPPTPSSSPSARTRDHRQECRSTMARSRPTDRWPPTFPAYSPAAMWCSAPPRWSKPWPTATTPPKPSTPFCAAPAHAASLDTDARKATRPIPIPPPHGRGDSKMPQASSSRIARATSARSSSATPPSRPWPRPSAAWPAACAASAACA